MILGWVAGEIFSGDPFIIGYLFAEFDLSQFEGVAQIAGVFIVFVSGYLWRQMHHVALDEA